MSLSPLMILYVILLRFKLNKQNKSLRFSMFNGCTDIRRIRMEKRIETAVNIIVFISLFATAWDLSLVRAFNW